MDDSQVPAENIEAAEDNSLDTSPVDETTTSEPVETNSDADDAQVNEPAAEEPEDSERKPSRAERRIRQLSDQVKQLEQTNQQFQSFGQPPALTVNPGEEISMEQYQQHVAQAAQSSASQIVSKALAQQEAKSNFQVDSVTLPEQFPELKEGDDLYTAELEEAISQEFQDKAFRVVGYNQVTNQPVLELDPSVRLADIAKRHVNSARALAEKYSARTKNSVATTADETALRPSGGASTDKDFASLSIEEMEAKLGTMRN